jgi:hypothetical protein
MNDLKSSPDAASSSLPTGDEVLIAHNSQEEFLKRRKTRNKALGLFLLALIALFYVVTVAKLGVNILKRPI